MISDNALVLRSSSVAVLTADATLAAKLIPGGTPLRGLALKVVVPSVTAHGGTGVDKLDITVRASSSSNPDSSERVSAHEQITAAGAHFVPFVFLPPKKYVEVLLDVTAGETSSAPNFGRVTVEIVDAAYDWSRKPNWG